MSLRFCSSILILTAATTLALPGRATVADDQKARIERLQDAVLAPCCYTEPVSRHQSEIAVKMRLEIAKWVTEGRTDQQILGTYVQLYGAKVLVDPRTRPEWWTPWIPWMAVILSVGLGFWLLSKWRAKPNLAGAEFAALPEFEEDE